MTLGWERLKRKAGLGRGAEAQSEGYIRGEAQIGG